MRVSEWNEWVGTLPAAPTSDKTGAVTLPDITPQEGQNVDASSQLMKDRGDFAQFIGIADTDSTVIIPAAISDKEYTLEDALYTILYRANPDFDLMALLQGMEYRDPLTGLFTPEFQTALLQFLQNSNLELEGGIDWERLFSDLQSLCLECEQFLPEKLQRQVDYLTSRYAIVQECGFTDIPSVKCAALPVRLNDLFSEVSEKLSQQYSIRVGGFFEENGIAGQKQVVYESVKAAIVQRLSEFTQFLGAEEDFAGVKAGQNQWLKNDDAFLAARLREVVPSNPQAVPKAVPSRGVIAPQTHYCQRDLMVAGAYVKETAVQSGSPEYQRGWVQPRATWADEESIGLDLAIQGIKTDVLVQQTGLGDGMRETIRNAYPGYVEKYVERLDIRMQSAPRNVPADQLGYAPIERDAVWNVYQKTLSVYIRGASMERALIEGARYGAERFAEKLLSGNYTGIYRYNQYNVGYWQNFYAVPPIRNGYEPPMSTFQKYLCNWNSFMSSLSSGRSEDIRLELSPEGRLSVDRPCKLAILGIWSPTDQNIGINKGKIPYPR